MDSHRVSLSSPIPSGSTIGVPVTGVEGQTPPTSQEVSQQQWSHRQAHPTCPTPGRLGKVVQTSKSEGGWAGHRDQAGKRGWAHSEVVGRAAGDGHARLCKM